MKLLRVIRALATEIPKGPSIMTYTESGFLILTTIQPVPEFSGESKEIFPDASKVSISFEFSLILCFISLTGILFSFSSSCEPEHDHNITDNKINKQRALLFNLIFPL